MIYTVVKSSAKMCYLAPPGHTTMAMATLLTLNHVVFSRPSAQTRQSHVVLMFFFGHNRGSSCGLFVNSVTDTQTDTQINRHDFFPLLHGE